MTPTFATLLVVIFCTKAAVIPIGNGSEFRKAGQACGRREKTWYRAKGSRHHFLYCHPRHGVLILNQCPVIGNIRKVFDAERQHCVVPEHENDSLKQQLNEAITTSVKSKIEHPSTATAKSTVIIERSSSSSEPTTTIMLTTAPALRSTTASTAVLQENVSQRFCSENRTVLRDSLGEPVKCALGEQISPQSCLGRSNFVCTFRDVNSTRGYCCQTAHTSQYRCPTTMSRTGSDIHLCSPLHLDSCSPAVDAVCVFDTLYGNYHCCRQNESENQNTGLLPTTNEVVLLARIVNAIVNGAEGIEKTVDVDSSPHLCPSGHNPYRSLHDVPKLCLPGLFGFFDGCPGDYSCRRIAAANAYHCCPDADRNSACDQSMTPFLDSLTEKPLLCSDKPGRRCPEGVRCEYNKGYDQNFCCSPLLLRSTAAAVAKRPKLFGKHGLQQNHLWPQTPNYATSALCSDGSAPYRTNGSSLTRLCHPHLRFSCPPSHPYCQYHTAGARYHCCRQKPHAGSTPANSRTRTCPVGMVALLSGAQPVMCQPTASISCPAESSCHYSPMYWQYICCAAPQTPEKNTLDFHHEGLLDANNSNSEAVYMLNPGDIGCVADSNCRFRGSSCQMRICHCPKGMRIFAKTCVYLCPPGYVESNRGRCLPQ